MIASETPTVVEAAEMARVLVETDEQHRVDLIRRLRQSERLSRTVRGLNRLLDVSEHRPLGQRALKCIGLELGG